MRPMGDHEIVRSRLKVWQFVVLIVLLAVAAVTVVQWRRFGKYDAAQLLSCLPLDHAVKVYIDADALRAGGFLNVAAGPQTVEEPDYRRFVEETGFDYRRDLKAVAASFVHGDVYLAVQGQFDWKRLSNYAREQRGTCVEAMCSMPASRPGRSISYYLLRRDVLAVAVAPEERGVAKITRPQGKRSSYVPPSPIWVSAPGEAFTDLRGLPDGSHILAPLAEAQEASFRVLEQEIQLDAACSSADVAARVAQRFTTTTNLLQSMLLREKVSPQPSDLSGVLVGGKFEARASHAIGTWPMQKQFVEALFSGGAR
jgi:hypothetical protein